MDRFLYALGRISGWMLWLVFYLFARHYKGRVFHRQGTVCKARIIALDDAVGPLLAGAARVRFSASGKPENSLEPSIVGMALEMANGEQDLPLATFESFVFHHDEGGGLGRATDSTDITDYLSKKNVYASVTPWNVDGVGTVWFRAHSLAGPVEGERRTDRLAAHAKAHAKLVLEMRRGPFAKGELIARIAEIELVAVLPTDAPDFTMRVTRTGRGIRPTGFRNGVRASAYPASQRGRFHGA